jgi:hypothetical protein
MAWFQNSLKLNDQSILAAFLMSNMNHKVATSVLHTQHSLQE